MKAARHVAKAEFYAFGDGSEDSSNNQQLCG